MHSQAPHFRPPQKLANNGRSPGGRTGDASPLPFKRRPVPQRQSVGCTAFAVRCAVREQIKAGFMKNRDLSTEKDIYKAVCSASSPVLMLCGGPLSRTPNRLHTGRFLTDKLVFCVKQR